MPVRKSLLKLSLSSGKTRNAVLHHELDIAIANGEHKKAELLSKELYQNTYEHKEFKAVEKNIRVNLYVEDKSSHYGPFPFEINPNITLGALKSQIEHQLKINRKLQHWIIGNAFATDDNSALSLTPECSLFLYLAMPEKQKSKPSLTLKTNVPINDIKKQTLQNDIIKFYKERNVNLPDVSTENISTVTEDFTSQRDQIVKSSASNATFNELSYSFDSLTFNESSYSTSLGPPSISDTQESLENKNDFLESESSIIIDGLNEPQRSLSTTSLQELTEQSIYEDLSDAGLSNVNQDASTNSPTWNGAFSADLNVNEQNNSIENEVDILKNEVPKDYHLLVELENEDLVLNNEPFECPVCCRCIEKDNGVVLRECLHLFCSECLANAVVYSEGAHVKCPFINTEYSCTSYLQDREIKALVTSEFYELYLLKSMRVAESHADKSFHCRTPDCPGWCIYEDKVNIFHCPVCRHINCISCQAVHENLNCRQYQKELLKQSQTDEESKKTLEFLNEMVSNGKAVFCPNCQVIVMKKWGCDWLKCSACQTEICWITKGPRWGPKGVGDTSAGCKCGVNGVKCHPQCNYCH